MCIFLHLQSLGFYIHRFGHFLYMKIDIFLDIFWTCTFFHHLVVLFDMYTTLYTRYTSKIEHFLIINFNMFLSIFILVFFSICIRRYIRGIH